MCRKVNNAHWFHPFAYSFAHRKFSYCSVNNFCVLLKIILLINIKKLKIYLLTFIIFGLARSVGSWVIWRQKHRGTSTTIRKENSSTEVPLRPFMDLPWLFERHTPIKGKNLCFYRCYVHIVHVNRPKSQLTPEAIFFWSSLPRREIIIEEQRKDSLDEWTHKFFHIKYYMFQLRFYHFSYHFYSSKI